VSDMNLLDSMAPPNATLIHNGPDSSQSIVLGCSLHYTCAADVVKRANPIAYIDSKTLGTKFLVMHGDDDRAVSWKQAQLLHDALRAKNVPSTLVIVPGVDHYFGRATAEQAKMVLDTLMNFLAESLGGIKSLISHSAEMTHKTIPAEIRRAAGVSDSLIRLSMGLEEPEDLISDLRNTFDRTLVRTNNYSKHLENC